MNFFYFALSILLLLVHTSCGSSNMFYGLQTQDTAKEACRLLEKKQPKKAIALLLKDLGTDYAQIFKSLHESSDMLQGEADLSTALEVLVTQGGQPANLVSILASAQAQLYAMDPLTIALALAGPSSSQPSSQTQTSDPTATAEPSSSELNILGVLFPILPDATSAHIHGLQTATMLLSSLGSHATKADQYKKAIFLTAGVALITKSLDTDHDNKISTIEAINLSDAAAESLITQIASAALSALSVDTSEEGSRSGASSQAILDIKSKISEEEGDTDSEKLRQYLSRKSS